MARFITVEIGCDWTDCGTRAPEGDPEIGPVELSIDRKQGREFLLCTKHREAFDNVVLPLMAAGVKVEIPARSTKKSASPSPSPSPSTVGTLVCRVPDCDRDGEPLKNNAGLAQHVIKAHQFESLDDYKLVYPDPIT